MSRLTGGSGDVNPQFLTFTATQSAADTTTTVQQVLPVQRLRNGNKEMVMEVLKVFYSFINQAEVDSTMNVFLSTASFGTTATNFGEPRVFSGMQVNAKLTTSGFPEETGPFVQDLTDGAGHGVLIGTDSIFAQVSSTTTSAANSARIKILYRWKLVTLPEYIGMVQSQQ